MSLLDLVKRWAELEPERVSRDPATPAWQVRLGDRDWPYYGGHNGGHRPVDEATVLAAVIEAIEARGWHWTLGHVNFTQPPIGPGHHAMVRAYVNDRPSDGPAAALLDAYLGAIAKEAT